MADSTIGNLPQLDRINPNDLYLVESGGIAHSVKGQAIIDMVEESKKGNPPALLSTVQSYQIGESGTDVPTGSWQHVIPAVPQGKFLWTKTEISWDTGTTVLYDVSRWGMDGAGSVSAVQNVLPDSSGNVDLTAALKAWNLEMNHPVGSWWLSDDPQDPGNIFGGTWQKFEGRGLIGAGTEYAVGSTGGESEHILTVDEMPAHSHSAKEIKVQTYTSGAYKAGMRSDTFPDEGNSSTSTVGGGLAHNNMPPYYATYMWKRTA